MKLLFLLSEDPMLFKPANPFQRKRLFGAEQIGASGCDALFEAPAQYVADRETGAAFYDHLPSK